MDTILKLANSGNQVAQELLNFKDQCLKITEKETMLDFSAIEKSKKIDEISTENLLKMIKNLREKDLERDPIFYNVILSKLISRAISEN